MAWLTGGQPKADEEDETEQQIADTEQQEGLLPCTQAVADPEQGTYGRPQVEQEVTQVQCQFAGLGLGQAVGHQRLARGVDEPVGEPAADHSDRQPDHLMGEAEQGDAQGGHQAAKQQYVAPPPLVRQPAAIEADQGGEGRRGPQDEADQGRREAIVAVEQDGEKGPDHEEGGAHHEGAQDDDPD
ncbi:hypothetical protein D3C72_1577540 [compost metagenome]